MTALAEALLAAQRQAIGALGKAYVAGTLDGAENVASVLDAIGCSDATDRVQLLAAWDLLREYGAPAPQPSGRPAILDEAASKPQLDLIARLADEQGKPAPTGPLTKAQASEVISKLKSGKYDADKVPF